jgi:enoyl-CoA hydratase/carnithine racemase
VWPVEELKEQAIKLAHELAAQPAQAVRGVLEVAVGCEDRTLEELLQAERAAVHKTFGSADLQEGMMAFLEKRKPVFNQTP